MVSTDYLSPTDLKEATKLLKKWKRRACVVAGGTNVIPEMRAGKTSPRLLLDITRVEELRGIQDRGASIWIGALTSVSQVMGSPLIEREGWILQQACKQLGNPLVRNRATIAGNLANASPAADTAVPLLALDAVVRVCGPDAREGEVPLSAFFLGPNRTILRDDDLITGIEFNKTKPPQKTAYFKLGLRKAMAISVASVAVWLETSGNRFSRVRIALGAVAPTPIRATETEAFLEGQATTVAVIDEAGQRVAQEVKPIKDIRGSTEYRRHVSQVLVRRAIQQALRE